MKKKPTKESISGRPVDPFDGPFLRTPSLEEIQRRKSGVSTSNLSKPLPFKDEEEAIEAASSKCKNCFFIVCRKYVNDDVLPGPDNTLQIHKANNIVKEEPYRPLDSDCKKNCNVYLFFQAKSDKNNERIVTPDEPPKLNYSIINSEARKWFVNHFPPSDDEEAKSLDKEINALTLSFPFWPIAKFATLAYLRVEGLRKRQKKATERYRSLKYELNLINKHIKDRNDLIQTGLIESDPIRVKDLNFIFDDPKEHTHLMKPIRAFAKEMAVILVWCGLSKVESSDIAADFIRVYFPSKKNTEGLDESPIEAEDIRTNLLR